MDRRAFKRNTPSPCQERSARYRCILLTIKMEKNNRRIFQKLSINIVQVGEVVVQISVPRMDCFYIVFGKMGFCKVNSVGRGGFHAEETAYATAYFNICSVYSGKCTGDLVQFYVVFFPRLQQSVLDTVFDALCGGCCCLSCFFRIFPGKFLVSPPLFAGLSGY